ncbi:MAG: HTH domain-containing protein [Halobacteria archaeon]|nr:HTH domain-containing protein [Halobacteria archaeon]
MSQESLKSERTQSAENTETESEFQEGTEKDTVHDTVSDEDGAGLKISIFARSFGSARAQANVVERIKKLGDAGKIDGYETQLWPGKVESSVKCEALDKFEIFEEWADENGITLEPYFKRENVYSSFTDDEKEIVVFPTVCVSVYEDGELLEVYPHSDGSHRYSVDDYLSFLESQSDGVMVENNIDEDDFVQSATST